MKLTQALFTAALGLALAGPAQAVHLDPGGRGQVLIYPYYTVNNGQQTLLSVTNTSSSAQSLRLRFREGYNGREVLDVNLWLSPYDVWTATVFALEDAGLPGAGAALFTTDSSCISPTITAANGTVNGWPLLPFTDAQFISRNADGGPTDLARTREGWIEIIAMADARGALSTAVTHHGATQTPPNCAAIQNVAVGNANLFRPVGRLSGTASIINVAQGTLLATRAEALAGFTGVSLFAEPGSLLPNLGSVNDGQPGGKATAHVTDSRGRLQSLSYGAPASNGFPATRPLDAVSAVLMAQRMVNEYSVNPAIGASSDWVLTFPTKNLYTDPRWIGTDLSLLAPFHGPFGPPGRSPFSLGIQTWDRQGRMAFPPDICAPIQPCYAPAAGYAVNVLPFSDVLADGTAVLHSRLPLYQYSPGFPLLYLDAAEGWAEVEMYSYAEVYSIEGKRLFGAPVIGFWATNLVNNQVSHGVLANYGAAIRHSSSVDCAAISAGQPAYCD